MFGKKKQGKVKVELINYFGRVVHTAEIQGVSKEKQRTIDFEELKLVTLTGMAYVTMVNKVSLTWI